MVHHSRIIDIIENGTHLNRVNRAALVILMGVEVTQFVNDLLEQANPPENPVIIYREWNEYESPEEIPDMHTHKTIICEEHNDGEITLAEFIDSRRIA